MACLMPFQLTAQTKSQTRQYTEEHPLIYEDGLDIWPYSYLNEQGEPEGFNIDLVRLLCEDLDIPVEIRLVPTYDAMRDLHEGKSDLMISGSTLLEHDGVHTSKSIVQLFTQSVVFPIGKQHVKELKDLGEQQVYVHNNSFTHRIMKERGWDANAIAYDDMKALMRKVSIEGNGQIVWNTMALKWLMRKFRIENLQMQPVDMPHAEYKFMSKDSDLLARLDHAYAVMGSERHEIEMLQNRWFYPELVESGIPSWVWYIPVGVVCITLILLSFNLFYRMRARKMSALAIKNTKFLSQIIKMSQMTLWVYYVKEHVFARVNEAGNIGQRCNILEFGSKFNHVDFENLCVHLRRVASTEEDNITLPLKSIDADGREYSVVLSVLYREEGRPTMILGTMNDMTETNKRHRESTQLMLRYKSIFETAMVDMIFYDAEGKLVNMNDRAVHTFGMTREQAIAMNVNLDKLMEDKEFDLQNFDYFKATLSMDFINVYLPEYRKPKSRVYYELQMVPVRDENGKLLGVYGTGMEVTDFVYNWRQHKQNIEKLRKANQEIASYVENINYVMEVGGVRIATYSPTNHQLTIYSKTDEPQHILTQTRCMNLIADSSKKQAMRLLNNMDNLTPSSIEITLKTNIRVKGQYIYLQINFIPIYDENGRVAKYFGMCRNVTDLKVTEQQLEIEATKAREVEELKTSFLRNMSYEIRTPLNTVVGFAELFEGEHSMEDENIFVGEIKKNASLLLNLINDILFLSRLDANMIEINKQPIDFAKTFEGHCQTAWMPYEKEGVHYIASNYYEQLVINIDDANLGRIIEQVAINAAQHTDQGTVRARYDYIDGRLIVAIEDTGCGISEEAMKTVYERFSTGNKNGTGLGLPISKELAEQMGGHIDINSQPGRGTTVWIIIPCEMTVMERKREV